MTPIEDLLRQTFAEREHDVDDLPLPVPPLRRPGRAGVVPAAARRRPRRAAAVLVGAAAVAAVLISTVTLAGSQSAPDHRDNPAGPAALRFTPTRIMSAGNRTSAVLTWAPTWTPAPETGGDITATRQVRYYGNEQDGGPFAAVTVRRGDCRSPTQHLDGDRGLAGSYTVCRPLLGGGALDIELAGIGEDPVPAAERLAASIRTGRQDQIALPVSLPAGTMITRLTVGPAWQADPSWQSRWQGEITTADGTSVHLGPPEGSLGATGTVGGRPANIDRDTVQLDLAPKVRANVVGRTHNRLLAVAAGLHLGSIPDYPWAR